MVLSQVILVLKGDIMEENKKVPQKLSYESDGKMGKNNNKVKANKKDPSEFFNTTQSSE
jgi:hypothetical protein